MDENRFYSDLILAGFILALVVFVALFLVRAPYGRYARQGWGPMIPSRFGWMLMEATSAISFAIFFFIGSAAKALPVILFFCLWEVHYVHRAFIYPFTIRASDKGMPLSVMGMAIVFNLGNAYTNGRYLFTLSGGYPTTWVVSPQFILGAALFMAGYAVNRWADLALRSLRKPGETGYCIPYGGLFRWISCPNYFGEITEWIGWAIATWSLAGLAFAVWTFANLAPRAYAHHKWYRSHFRDYPSDRKALIPLVW